MTAFLSRGHLCSDRTQEFIISHIRTKTEKTGVKQIFYSSGFMICAKSVSSKWVISGSMLGKINLEISLNPRLRQPKIKFMKDVRKEFDKIIQQKQNLFYLFIKMESASIDLLNGAQQNSI